MATHRYWRIDATSHNAPPFDLVNYAEVMMREYADGPNVCFGGTAFVGASGEATTPDSAQDGQGWTDWRSSTPPNTWYAYDFGAGNEKEIFSVILRARNAYATQMPSEIRVEYSDDASVWTEAWRTSSIPAWSTGEVREFSQSAPTLGGAGHPFWRVSGLNEAGDPLLSATEVEMRSSLGGANECSGGRGFAPTRVEAGDSVAAVFDGLLNNSKLSTSDPFGYCFSSKVSIEEVLWRTREGSWFNQGPVTLTLEYSDDYVTWTEAWSTTHDLTPLWTSGESRTFAKDTPVPATDDLAITNSTPSTGASPGTASLVLSGGTPVATKAIAVYPSAGTLSISSGAPTLFVPLQPATDQIGITGGTPTIETWTTAQVFVDDFLPEVEASLSLCGAAIEVDDFLPTFEARGGATVSLADFLPEVEASGVSGKTASLSLEDFLPTVETRTGHRASLEDFLPALNSEGIVGKTVSATLRDFLPEVESLAVRHRQASVSADDFLPRLQASGFTGDLVSASLSDFLPTLKASGIKGSYATLELSDFLPALEATVTWEHDGEASLADFLPVMVSEGHRSGRFDVSTSSELLRYVRPA